MANGLMLLLSLAVVVTTGAVLALFFRRLKRIEEDLWGEKRKEAADTALADSEQKTQKPDTETTES